MKTLRILRLFWAREGLRGFDMALPIIALMATSALMLTVLGGTLMFWNQPPSEFSGFYQVLSVIALSLLVVPLQSLSAGAARLSARRKDRRLAILSLLGMGNRELKVLTVLESTLLASAGAVLGIGLYYALTPVVGLIHFLGGPIGASSLWLSWYWIVCVVISLIALSAIAGIWGLRGVQATPLGVVSGTPPKASGWVKALVCVIGIGLLYLVTSSAMDYGMAGLIIGASIAFFLGLWLLNVLGPIVLSFIARFQLKRAKTATRVLQTRHVLAYPKVHWKQISGIAMSTFIAMIAGSGLSVISAADPSGDEDLLMQDLRTGVYLTLGITFVLIALTVAITQAAAALDQRGFYRQLDLVGVPLDMLREARRQSLLSSAWSVLLISAITAGLLVLPLVGMAMVMAPLSFATLIATIGCGYLLIVGSIAVTNRLWQPSRDASGVVQLS